MSEAFQDTEPGLTPDQEFQHQWDIADAKLGVAEHFAWPLAIGWGLLAGTASHNLLIGLVVFGAGYYFARRPYAKESARFDQLHKQKTFGTK